MLGRTYCKLPRIHSSGMKIISIAFIACCILASCSKDSGGTNPPPSPADGLMPLQTGDSWDYLRKDYDPAGNLLDSLADHIQVTGSTTVGSTSYYIINWGSFPVNGNSFFVNTDSSTLTKIDSSTQYIFFKKIAYGDSVLIGNWKDTVSTRCQGNNYLFAFSDNFTVNGRSCLKNTVSVADCTGATFEKWVYYLQPQVGLVRIEHYVLSISGSFYLKMTEDLTNYSV